MIRSWVLPALLAGSAFVRADEPGKHDVSADAGTKLAAYMAAREKVSQFTGAVMVALDGVPLHCAGYGPADADHDVPNSPITKFRIGSVTKQFTAVAILLLEREGKLRTTDPVGKHLPDCPPAWAGVTIHQLLSHTAGVPEHTSILIFNPSVGTKPYTPKAITDLVKDKPLDFAPGEKFKYSNTGYILLGQVVESESGKEYGTFLREAVLDPLGMTDTGVERNGQVLKHRATGYSPSGTQWTAAQHLHLSLPFAAGAMYSTVRDLAIWDRAIAGHKLLTQAETAKLFTPVKDGYAYGFNVATRFGTALQEHGGGIPGFNSRLCRYPEKGLFVTVLANVEQQPLSAVANELAAAALGKPYEHPRVRREGRVPEEVLDRYVGDYAREKAALAVSRDGGTLRYKIDAGPIVALTAEAPGRFFSMRPGQEVDARFTPDGEGKATELQLRVNGVETAWVRRK